MNLQVKHSDIGKYITCRKTVKMIDDNQIEAIKGKKYKIVDVFIPKNDIIIINEHGHHHHFNVNKCIDYFNLSELRRSEKLKKL